MEIKNLKMKSLFKNKIFIFTLIYFLIKIFSFYFSPNTPLYSANPINTIISVGILSLVCGLLIKKKQLGWIIIATELILGGGGGYFAILGISLRTLLLITSIGIYTVQNFQFKNNKFNTHYLVLATLLVWAGTSSLIGYFNGHELQLIYSDFIPYLYLLYFFPLHELLKKQQFKNTAWKMLIASIIGNLIFILFIFFTFSSEIFILQENFYYWYRQIALGKITDTGTGFFRVVLDEHLLLIPIAVLILSKMVKKVVLFSIPYSPPATPESSSVLRWRAGLLLTLYSLLLIILSTNITRIYMLALFIGWLFLFSKKYWGSWIKYGALTGIIFLISFSSLNMIASKGSTLGFELLLSRLNSIASPSTELSSLSRMLLFPEIIEKIKENPILGSGLGDTITVYSPILEKQITTSHFDWGYLEIFAEMGLVGLIIWLSLILYLFIAITRNTSFSIYTPNTKYKNINYLIIPFLSLLIINITSPALFHSLGIIFITFIFSRLENPNFFSSSAGGIIINPKNKIAIVSNMNGKHWTFPKGTIEENELVKDTALRETYEETGINDLKIVDHFLTYYRIGHYKNLSHFKKMYLYIFHTEITEELTPIDLENPEAKWVDIGEVTNKLSNKKDQKIFLNNLNKINKWKR